MKNKFNPLLKLGIQKLPDNLTDLDTRSHTSLTDIGSNTHAQVDTHIAATGISVHGLGTMSTQTETNYALLAGRATPQTIAFGTGAGATTGYLTSTSHATKGSFSLNAAGTIVVDELNARLNIGTPSGVRSLNVNGIIEVMTATTAIDYANRQAALDVTRSDLAASYFNRITSSSSGYLKDTTLNLDISTGPGSTITALTANGLGQVGIGGITAPTAMLHLIAGTATANTAPLKFTSGALLTIPEAGAVEFLNDAYYGTITTGAARKQFLFTDGSAASLTSFPTLNQNTTGSAATLTTPRTIGGVSFNGSANITVASATGGFTVSGGDLALGANNITMSGSLAATGTRVTKGWFTDLEVTNAPTLNTVAIPSISSTSTFTNKRNTPRVYNTTSTATLTPEIATYDIFELTAQAAALNIANHSTSTPTAGEKMIIRIKDNATPRAITYGTYYRAMGNALPTTTVASKTMYLGFIWNAADTKWDLIALAQEA